MHNKNNISLERINFENKPSTKTPINNTNLNLLQDNVDELCQTIQDDLAINTTNIETNSKSIEVLKGEILWTNSNVMNEFNAQAIEVNLTNYDYYEMLFLQAFNIQRICSTNKLPTTFLTTLSITFNGKPWSRDVNIDGNMNVSIDNAYSFDTHGSSVKTQNNGALIPYQLIAYKIER